MQSPHTPLLNHTKQNQHQNPTQAALQHQHQQHHTQTPTSSFRRHTIDASYFSRHSKAILLWTGRKSKWQFASFTGVLSQKHHTITHRHRLRNRASIIRDMLTWNWKDALMFRTQPKVVEDIDPLVIVEHSEHDDVMFVDEGSWYLGKGKDRPGWHIIEQDSDIDTSMYSDLENCLSSDDETVIYEDFGDDGTQEPYIVIPPNEKASLSQKFAAIDLSPGRINNHSRRSIHDVQSKIQHWSALMNDERQLVQGIHWWLESLISENIWNISPCGQPPDIPSICGGTPSTCPLCLIRCLKPYPEWEFLFPILEESVKRMRSGAYAMRYLNKNLAALEDSALWKEDPPARYHGNILNPPRPQRLTRKMEAQSSGAERRRGKLRRETTAMEQSTILPR